MALKKVKLGDLINVVDERNNIGSRDFYGININKEFMPTVADTTGLDETKYKVVRKNRFVYSGMQTGRDECIRISMYLQDKPIIVSPAYTTFEVTAQDIVLPEYFFMLFLSKEKDRLGWFYSDSSIRSNLDWDRFCEMELALPPIDVQKKYVDIYLAMLANQRAYEQGLDDLKLVCDAYIEDLRRKMPSEEIGEYLILSDRRNDLNLSVDFVRGLATSKEMIPTKADMDGVKLDNYKLVLPGQIAYVSDTSRRADKISLGYEKGSRVAGEILYYISTDWIKDGLKYEQDHLHPYERFNQSQPSGVTMQEWAKWRMMRNKLPNLQYLEGRENGSKNDMSLEQYFNDMNVQQQAEFKNNSFIPDNVSLDIAHFDEFYKERKALLKTKIKTLLG